MRYLEFITPPGCLFQIPIRGRVTFVCGLNAIGKTKIYEAFYDNLATLPADSQFRVFSGDSLYTLQLDLLDHSKINLFIFDEDDSLNLYQIADKYSKYPKIYLLFLRRDIISFEECGSNQIFSSDLVYSLKDLQTLCEVPSPVWNPSFSKETYTSIFTTQDLYTIGDLSSLDLIPDRIVTEDSTGGFECIKSLSSLPCTKLSGRGNLNKMKRTFIVRQKSKILLLYDMANVKDSMHKLIELKPFIRLWDYPSFEGFILERCFGEAQENLWMTLESRNLEKDLARRLLLRLPFTSVKDMKSRNLLEILQPEQVKSLQSWVDENTNKTEKTNLFGS